jgi:predicted dehydrogenase
MKKLRIAVLGAGNWGRNHVRTVATLPEAELVAICDPDASVRHAMARSYPGALATDSVDEALGVADAVVVATPAASHAALALLAIERGLPVLVEKPFALSSEEASVVADAAASKGVPLVVGHLLVFHPAVERLKSMIEAGELGEVFYLYSQRVNLGQIRPDENALWRTGARVGAW